LSFFFAASRPLFTWSWPAYRGEKDTGLRTVAKEAKGAAEPAPGTLTSISFHEISHIASADRLYSANARDLMSAMGRKRTFRAMSQSSRQTPISTHIGAWSLVFSQLRGERSTLAALNLAASCGLRSEWSMRMPASR